MRLLKMTVCKLRAKWTWQDGMALAFILVAISAAFILAGLRKHDFGNGTPEWWVSLILIGSAYLCISLSRGAKLWDSFSKRENEGRRRIIGRDMGNPFGELFLYLILSLLILSSLALNFNNPVGMSFSPIDLDKPEQLTAFFAALFVAFLPLLICFRWRKNAIQKSQRNNGVQAEAHISNESIAVGALIIIAIGCLAWMAGEGAIPRHSGFGAVILVIVLCIFLLFISFPHFHAFLSKRSTKIDAHAAGLVAPSPSGLMSRADNFLVRSLAPLTGALQSSGFQLWPHILLISIFIPLTILGYALPEPYGLLPIFFALMLAVSLGRRWAWVEADRETAMRIHTLNDNQNIKIGFGNDLRDEALLGYAFLFVLIPLALRQIQLWIAPFAPAEGLVDTQGSLTDWAQFFGIELAKGVPIVDWADIYGIQPDVPFVAENAMSKHLVFVARLMVDLVIIAALLQAWGIIQRNRAQLRLFKSGQLDLLDPFTERRYFEQGVSVLENGEVDLSTSLLSLFEEHASASEQLTRGRIPYNIRRLSELRASRDPKMREMVDFLAREYDLLVGPVVAQIGTYRERFVIHNKPPSREQRIELEHLLNEALEQNVRLSYNDSLNLRAIIAHVAEFPSFYNAKLEAFELLANQKPTHAVKALMAGLFDRAQLQPAGFMDQYPTNENWVLKREPIQESRQKIIQAITRIRLSKEGHGVLSRRAKDLCESVLRWAASNESSMPSEAAREALAEIDKEARVIKSA